VAKSPEARRQLSECENSLNIEEDVLQDLFQFTQEVIYGDKKSSTMAKVLSFKWKTLKNKAFILLPADEDSLRQHCVRANYLAYLVLHPTKKHHPSPTRIWLGVGG